MHDKEEKAKILKKKLAAALQVCDETTCTVSSSVVVYATICIRKNKALLMKYTSLVQTVCVCVCVGSDHVCVCVSVVQRRVE